MPIYEYEAKDDAASCGFCARGFDLMQTISDSKLAKCPKCGAAVVRKISAPSIGMSHTGLDHRAKAAGFHKLQRLGKGEYEKQY